MRNKISRREWLGVAAGAMAAAAPASNWIFALNGDGAIVKAATKDAGDWKPVFFSKRQAEGLANLADAIIPRTDTPGARDARVHEYIDLAMSVESESAQERFTERFTWLEKRAKKQFRKGIEELDPAECAELLEPLSDLHDDHPEELQPGAALVRDIKTRTVFGYYTSLEGRVQELGLPPEVGMETWQGCTHEGGH